MTDQHSLVGGPDGASQAQTVTREGDLLIVDLERFQGPMDLLLHLIRTQDIDIFDIPIARITRQFLVAIEALQAAALDEAGEFLEMAAGLVRIKAQMLLPRSGDDEDEDPRAELVRRLLEYEQVREIAQRLRAAENDRSRRFSKGYVPPRPRARRTDTPLETTWDDVFQAALQVKVPTQQELEHRVTTRPVAMSEKVHLIIRTLKRVQRIEFSRLVEPWRERMHGVMTLLAGLELGRRRVVTLRQSRPFSELWIYKQANLEDDALVADLDAGELELDTGALKAPEEIRP
ncbi:MAG: segregation/condensation protein A [Gemmatimonadetes bacterium]|nr:segregation/condensation protein A [Gemmatimonadota bacterium]